MNSKGKGEVSEGVIMAELLKRGYSVSVPFGDNQRYDFILDRGGELLKVQAKTGRLSEGCVIFQTSSKNGFTGQRTDYRGQVDLFMVYAPALDAIYSVPVGICGRSETRLRIDPTCGGPTTTVRWARDYELAL